MELLENIVGTEVDIAEDDLLGLYEQLHQEKKEILFSLCC